MQRPRNTLFAMMLAALVALVPLSALAQPEFAGVSLYHLRPHDQGGISMFEPLPLDRPYNGIELYIGGAFTQQFQAVEHSNEAEAVMNEEGVNTNELLNIGPGFNLATANFYLGAQLAQGIRVDLTTYLSSRHHPEAWVKGGYLIVDELPMFKSEAIDNIMDIFTIKAGHFEINYGDAHFRRTDNGMALYNPFVGNYILDSFTTEIGGEVYARHNDFLAMVGVTSGELKGAVVDPESRSPSFYGKLGVDRQMNDDLRVRLTGSAYTTAKSNNNTLYGGDRAGARFYSVFDTPVRSGFTNPRINPNFRDDITAFQINPFVKFQGLELFGVLEWASGSLASEADNRSISHYAVEGLYRFLANEQVYVGGRYNVVTGELLPNFSPNDPADVSSTRYEIGGGWFVTPNVLVKAEYVRQDYNDFPTNNLFHEGSLDGFMLEGVIAF